MNKIARPQGQLVNPFQQDFTFFITDVTSGDHWNEEENRSSAVFYLHGITERSETVLVRYLAFQPYFYLKIPQSADPEFEKYQIKQRLESEIANHDSYHRSFYRLERKEQMHRVEVEVCRKVSAIGFRNGLPLIFLKFSFRSIACYRLAAKILESMFPYPTEQEVRTLPVERINDYVLCENNIPLEIKFSAYLDIPMCGWVKLSMGGYSIPEDETIYRSRYSFDIKRSGSLTKFNSNEIAPALLDAFDIECIKLPPNTLNDPIDSFDAEALERSNDAEGLPDSKNPDHPIVAISHILSYYNHPTNKNELWITFIWGEREVEITDDLRRDLMEEGFKGRYSIPYDDIIIVRKENEAEMLRAWVDFISSREVQPCVSYGHNILGYDLGVLYDRVSYHVRAKSLDERYLNWGRLSQKVRAIPRTLETKAIAHKDMIEVSIPGRMILDTLSLFTRDTTIRLFGYGLGELSAHFLKLGKVDLDPSKIRSHFLGTPAMRGKLAIYNLIDCRLVQLLLSIRGLFPKCCSDAKVNGVPPNFLCTRGAQIKCMAGYYREALRKDVVMYRPKYHPMLDEILKAMAEEAQRKKKESEYDRFVNEDLGPESFLFWANVFDTLCTRQPNSNCSTLQPSTDPFARFARYVFPGGSNVVRMDGKIDSSKFHPPSDLPSMPKELSEKYGHIVYGSGDSDKEKRKYPEAIKSDLTPGKKGALNVLKSFTTPSGVPLDVAVKNSKPKSMLPKNVSDGQLRKMLHFPLAPSLPQQSSFSVEAFFRTDSSGPQQPVQKKKNKPSPKKEKDNDPWSVGIDISALKGKKKMEAAIKAFSGGYVSFPKPNLWQVVAVGDFSSLYPSIMFTWCLDGYNLVLEAEFANLPDVKYVDLVFGPFIVFRFAQTRGVLLEYTRKLIAERKISQALMGFYKSIETSLCSFFEFPHFDSVPRLQCSDFDRSGKRKKLSPEEVIKRLSMLRNDDGEDIRQVRAVLESVKIGPQIVSAAIQALEDISKPFKKELSSLLLIMAEERNAASFAPDRYPMGEGCNRIRVAWTETHKTFDNALIRESMDAAMDLLDKIVSYHDTGKCKICGSGSPIEDAEEFVRWFGNQKEIMNSVQLAQKTSANSTFGFCSATGFYGFESRAERFRMVDPSPADCIRRLSTKALCGAMPVSACITFLGRWAIETSEQYVKTVWGGTVVYIDTDSLFIVFPVSLVPKNEAGFRFTFELMKRVCKEITDLFPPGGAMKIVHEKTAKTLNLLGPKMYVFDLYEYPDDVGKVVIKGLPFYKRDSCKKAKDVCTSISEVLIATGNVHRTIDHMKASFDDILAGKYVRKDFIMGKKLSKGRYEGQLPHVCLAQKINERTNGLGPKSGDYVKWLVIDIKDMTGKQPLQNKIEEASYALSKDLPLDLLWYFRNQFKNNLLKIFSSIREVDLHPLLDEIEQKFFVKQYTGESVLSSWGSGQKRQKCE